MTPDDWITTLKLSGLFFPFTVAFILLMRGEVLTKAHHLEVVNLYEERLADKDEELDRALAIASASVSSTEEIVEEVTRKRTRL